MRIIRVEKWRIQDVDIDENLTSIGIELLSSLLSIHFLSSLDLITIKDEVIWCSFWLFTFYSLFLTIAWIVSGIQFASNLTQTNSQSYEVFERGKRWLNHKWWVGLDTPWWHEWRMGRKALLASIMWDPYKVLFFGRFLLFWAELSVFCLCLGDTALQNPGHFHFHYGTILPSCGWWWSGPKRKPRQFRRWARVTLNI